PCQEPECIANDIADAGLLAPDLPEPNDPNVFVPNGKGWLPGGPYGPSVWTAPGGTVMVQRIEPGDLTPEEARGIAHALLAAADYAEGRIATLTSANS
ncbi:hypothetical protein, partial [Rhizobium ruizarguesonis]|uniref:hypothetical protein n=1 Tax=Rhizobium ruizarguesonis TaxID=2081791 RepID=UPI001954B0CA